MGHTMDNIEYFTIQVPGDIGIQANLSIENPYINIFKGDIKVESFCGREEVARFCQSSLLSILEMLSGVRDEIDAIKVSDTDGADTDGADVIPINRAEKFSN